MPPVNRVNLSTAGGLITGSPQTGFIVDGYAVAVDGSSIASHGDSPHNAAVTANGQPRFRIDGIPVNRDGDIATCGHSTSSGVSRFTLS